MTNEERQRILDILAYNVGSVYFALGGISTTKEFCYQKAEQVLKHELEINGEEYILHLLDKDEDEQKI